MRQGAQQPGWLIYNAFTAEPHKPALMFPLYVGLGKLAATVHVAPVIFERLTEVLARALLVLALWRFAHAFASDRIAASAAFLLSLFGSGFEVLALPFGGYTGNWSYELNTLGMLFSAPHLALAMAATLELARGWLGARGAVRVWHIAYAAVLSLAIALLHPFHLPVLLAAIVVVGLTLWRNGQRLGSFAGGVGATLAAAPVLALTASTFSLDPFWSATYTRQNVLPSPVPHELVVDLGVTLLLAIGGAIMLRGRVAPFGLLVWLLLGVAAMYLPLPYQRRLALGIQPALTVLAANALVAACAALTQRRAAVLRLGVVAAAASATLLVVVGALSSSASNWPLRVYRSTADLDAAADYLASQVQPRDVIVADWQVGNYLAPRSTARVLGGHPVATLHAREKELALDSLFAHQASLDVARQFGAQWLVYGPDQATLAVPAPPAFQAGDVRVFRIADSN
jgi:hypothetical protein